MKTTATAGFLVAAALVGSGVSLAAAPKAVADLAPRSGSSVSGTATFTAKAGKVKMKVALQGLTPGKHAIHLHEKGDCSALDATSAGGHWNPSSENHGKWGQAPFHHGDIGNVVADAKGKAELTLETDLWTIGDGKPSDIIGHAVVVHAMVDDFTTQPSGNAGGRVACGVIKAAK